MKPYALLFFVGLATLATSCGQDAASKKQAADAETQVVASITQVLQRTTSRDSALGPVHTWYQSEVPNIVKLDPNAAKVYQDHAALLQEVATHEQKLASDPILTPTQGQGVRTMYQKLVAESSANVAQLTNLASSKTTMSEAEQRKFVGELASKETHQLQLTQYYSKRTAAIIDQRGREKKGRELDRQMFGHD